MTAFPVENRQVSLFQGEQIIYAANGFVESIEASCDEDWLAYRDDKKQGANHNKTILSLFDYTGNWARPYLEAGYDVICLDIKDGYDVNEFSVEYLTEYLGIEEVYGILAGVPCTEFAGSGARWFKEKDADGRTEKAVELVNQTLRTVEFYAPYFWAIENPVGRLGRLVPELSARPWYFNPSDFGRGFPGEDYTKKTGLWGKFVPPTIENLGDDRSVFPAQGSKMHRLYGGKSEATKMARSVTPKGFSKAFFECNP